jgi:N-acetylmuramoyl-L-alanine amidase
MKRNPEPSKKAPKFDRADQALLPLEESFKKKDSAPPKAAPTYTTAAKSRLTPPKAAPSPDGKGVGAWRKLCHAFRMEYVTPTVGLMTFAGCLTFLIAPEEGPGDPRVAVAIDPSLPTIVVDAGHGGRDEGARSNGLVEKELTLDMAFRVEKLLQTYGFRTVMTRRDDTYVPLPERTDVGNRIPRSLFVSIHFNKSANPEASGVETFYASEKVVPEPEWSFAGFFAKRDPLENLDTGENFAGYIQTALLSRTQAGDRGIKGKAFYVVRHTRSPAVLVEGGFLSNVFEAELISTPQYRDRLAAAIVDGVIQYSNTLPRPVGPSTNFAKASP